MVSTATAEAMPMIVVVGHVYFHLLTKERNSKVPFGMAIANEELMHEWFPKHLAGKK